MGGKNKITNEIQQIIDQTVNATVDRLSKISVMDVLKNQRDLCFINTERLLYNYISLKEHVADENEYMAMIQKNKSSSVVIYNSKSSNAPICEDEAAMSRLGSLERSRRDLERIERAIDKVRDRKGFDVIVLRYFSKKDDGNVRTFEEIAEQLGLSDKTVRTYRQNLIKDISVYLFGSDAIA